MESVAPFYVGQEVVAVNAAPGAYFHNGQDYVISAVEYKLGNPHHPVGRVTKYWYVGIEGFNGGGAYYRPGIFRAKLKLGSKMTFKEIVETEVLEVLFNN